jgi:hypothetical protein
VGPARGVLCLGRGAHRGVAKRWDQTLQASSQAEGVMVCVVPLCSHGTAWFGSMCCCTHAGWLQVWVTWSSLAPVCGCLPPVGVFPYCCGVCFSLARDGARLLGRLSCQHRLANVSNAWLRWQLYAMACVVLRLHLFLHSRVAFVGAWCGLAGACNSCPRLLWWCGFVTDMCCA